MRWCFTPLAALTAVFGPLLFLLPGSTEDYWSWPIRPDMSAVWVGVAYTFGAIAITTMLITGKWRFAMVPVAPIIAIPMIWKMKMIPAISAGLGGGESISDMQPP